MSMCMLCLYVLFTWNAVSLHALQEWHGMLCGVYNKGAHIIDIFTLICVAKYHIKTICFVFSGSLLKFCVSLSVCKCVREIT